jgi:hydrogenase maturation protease
VKQTPTTGPAARRIRVAGLGNVLMGDDGVGPTVVEALRAAYEWPANVSLVDLGTPGLDLVPFVADLDCLIVIDAVAAPLPPGSLHVYHGDDLPASAESRLAAHDPGLRHALALAALEGKAPSDFLLIGIVPERVEVGPGLSESARTSVPGAMAAVVGELARRGVVLPRRDVPHALATWWETRAVATATARP